MGAPDAMINLFRLRFVVQRDIRKIRLCKSLSGEAFEKASLFLVNPSL
jgi:hypothetical protein